MGRAALPRRLSGQRDVTPWGVGVVRGWVAEAAHATTIHLDVPDWPGHTPGHHVDVRLTAPDGYETERSYSIASAPEDPTVAITVERLPDGEVSPYLTDELRPGDPLELRGPIGGPFTWHTGVGGPLLLIGGGSGLVPLMAMLRHRARHHSTIETRPPVSARPPGDLLYPHELAGLARTDELTIHATFTREPPPRWTGFARRVDAEMLIAVGPAPERRPRIFACGPTAFVERAADLLVELGHEPPAIRIERFGPTGGCHAGAPAGEPAPDRRKGSHVRAELGPEHPLLLLEDANDVGQDVLGGDVDLAEAVHPSARALAGLSDPVDQLAHDDVVLDGALGDRRDRGSSDHRASLTVGDVADGDRALRDRVGQLSPRVDDLVEVQVQRPEQGADDAPVQLLADQREIDELLQGRLELMT